MPVNTLPTRGPKLRNSCDACHLAKVKCSKARPACARCQSHQVQCIYGISMRSGKHSATRSNIRKPSQGSPQSINISHRESTFADPSLLSEERCPFFTHSTPSTTNSMHVNDNWMNLSPLENSSNNLESLTKVDDSTKLQQNYPQCYNENVFEGPQPHLDWNDAQSIPRDLYYTEPQALPIPLDTPITPKTPSAIISRAIEPKPAVTLLSPCFCQRDVLQQLLELTKGPGVLASFDVVLNQTREVISFCHSILNDKTCSDCDISGVLTFAALIAKIISVYESIYPMHHEVTPSPKSSTQFTGNTWSGDDGAFIFASAVDDSQSICSPVDPSNPASCWTTPFPPTLSPSTMASGWTATAPLSLRQEAVQLDQKGEENFKMDIFKIEIAKVGNLIKAFGQRYAGRNSQAQYEDRGDCDMVSFLEKKLWNSLQMLREEGR